MRRVVFNQKGGVGKSSIAVNLAAISAARGYRTLVIDLDPQCNASQYLLGDEALFPESGKELEPNIGQFFAQTLSFKLVEKSPESFVHETPYENLYLIPSNPELREIEHLLESKHKIFKLRGALKTLSQQYDAIYIDTPPAFNFYTLSALIGADSCIIPFDCDAFSRRALYTLMENVEEVVVEPETAAAAEPSEEGTKKTTRKRASSKKKAEAATEEAAAEPVAESADSTEE